MKNNRIKASKIVERKTKVKVVDWVSQKRARGIRNIPIDVTTSTSPSKPRRATERTEDNEATSQEATFQHMDVDEAFWIEEPDVLKKKNVSLPICHSFNDVWRMIHLSAGRAHIHGRVYSSDRLLLALPSQL
jgi:hypothetical protein